MSEGIYKRGKKSNVWSIVINTVEPETGKRKQKWYSFTGTKRQAEEERTRLLRERDTGCLVDVTKMSVSEFLQYWLRTQVAINGRPKTLAEYKYRSERYIIPQFGNLALSKLTAAHIREFYGQLYTTGQNGKPLAASSITAIHATLNAALKQAIIEQAISRSPADSVKPPKAQPRKVKVWTVEEVKAFLDAASEDESSYVTCVALALYTGMRISELVGLCWQSVDFERSCLRVVQQIQRIRGVGKVIGETKTASGARRIALSQLAVDLLRKHKARQNAERLRAGPAYDDSGLVFANPLGQSLDERALRAALARTIKAAGVPRISFHGLRHCHASLLLAENVHVKIVSERLGHANAATTLNVYSHLLPGLQDSAAARLDTVLRPALPDQVDATRG